MAILHFEGIELITMFMPNAPNMPNVPKMLSWVLVMEFVMIMDMLKQWEYKWHDLLLKLINYVEMGLTMLSA